MRTFPPPSSRLSVSLCPSSNRIRGFPNSPFSLPCILGRALQLALRFVYALSLSLSLPLCLSAIQTAKLRCGLLLLRREVLYGGVGNEVLRVLECEYQCKMQVGETLS